MPKMTKEEQDAFMQQKIAELASAYTKMEARRDRAAIFIFNNFENVLHMFTRRDGFAETELAKLREAFFDEEFQAGYLGIDEV